MRPSVFGSISMQMMATEKMSIPGDAEQSSLERTSSGARYQGQLYNIESLVRVRYPVALANSPSSREEPMSESFSRLPGKRMHVSGVMSRT